MSVKSQSGMPLMQVRLRLQVTLFKVRSLSNLFRRHLLYQWILCNLKFKCE